MADGDYMFTSECVTMGHPDKVADQISDGILDKVLECDYKGRVACETLVTKGLVFVAGEMTTECWVDINRLIRDIVKEIGYTFDQENGFYFRSLAVVNTIHEQSPEIGEAAAGVGRKAQTKDEYIDSLSAGDQGMMFGFACDETEELMPMPITLARALCDALARARRDGVLDWLRPDGKTQVTVIYRDGRPVGLKEIVVSTHHAPLHDDKEKEDALIREAIIEEVVRKAIPSSMLEGFDFGSQLLVNPSGRFTKGGPGADTGLTGRKIIVDTYGGMGRHGGGCFSGKDPSKVDRSGAYAARYIAKNIVAAGLARRCEVEIAYAIGLKDPRSIYVDTFGTGVVPETKLADAIREIFPLKVSDIVRHFDLLRPIYLRTAREGHFGIPDYPWEKTDKVEALKDYFGK